MEFEGEFLIVNEHIFCVWGPGEGFGVLSAMFKNGSHCNCHL
jgi:hypothetical protein